MGKTSSPPKRVEGVGAEKFVCFHSRGYSETVSWLELWADVDQTCPTSRPKSALECDFYSLCLRCVLSLTFSSSPPPAAFFSRLTFSKRLHSNLSKILHFPRTRFFSARSRKRTKFHSQFINHEQLTFSSRGCFYCSQNVINRNERRFLSRKLLFLFIQKFKYNLLLNFH